jgi:branched-chain amino acid transport system ATP-binding protein
VRLVPPALDVTELSAGYGAGGDVLHEVSFTVAPGSITAIVGPNGAGKSTLLRTLYGLTTIRNGRVRLHGRDVTGWAPGRLLRDGLAWVPQGRCNFPLMSVRENLQMGLYVRRDGEARADLERIVERFPLLGAKAHLLAGNLSGGEQQILEMAMALLVRPRVIMLDEPSIGLAPRAVTEVFATIAAIRAEGTTVMIVEQNVKRVLEIADHAIVLDLGRKRFEGAGPEVLANPRLAALYLGGAPA